MLLKLGLGLIVCLLPLGAMGGTAGAGAVVAEILLLSPDGKDALATAQRFWDSAEGGSPDFRVLRNTEAVRHMESIMDDDAPGWSLLSAPRVTFDDSLKKQSLEQEASADLAWKQAMPPVAMELRDRLVARCEREGGGAAVIGDLSPPDYGVLAGFYVSPNDMMHAYLRVNTRIDIPGRTGKGGVQSMQHASQEAKAEVSGVRPDEPVLLLQREGSSYLVTIVKFTQE